MKVRFAVFLLATLTVGWGCSQPTDETPKDMGMTTPETTPDMTSDDMSGGEDQGAEDLGAADMPAGDMAI